MGVFLEPGLIWPTCQDGDGRSRHTFAVTPQKPTGDVTATTSMFVGVYVHDQDSLFTCFLWGVSTLRLAPPVNSSTLAYLQASIINSFQSTSCFLKWHLSVKTAVSLLWPLGNYKGFRQFGMWLWVHALHWSALTGPHMPPGHYQSSHRSRWPAVGCLEGGRGGLSAAWPLKHIVRCLKENLVHENHF